MFRFSFFEKNLPNCLKSQKIIYNFIEDDLKFSDQ